MSLPHDAMTTSWESADIVSSVKLDIWMVLSPDDDDDSVEEGE
jgi:hypothetical protein